MRRFWREPKRKRNLDLNNRGAVKGKGDDVSTAGLGLSYTNSL